MEINVRGKNIEVTEALVDYAQKKISKLTKYLDRPKEAKEAQVVMSVIRNKHIVEVTVI